jgi:protease I
MQSEPLAGRRVAVLSTLGFERVELVGVHDALVEAGAEVHVVAPEGPTIRAFEFPNWSDEIAVDRTLAEASPADYDALYLPGGIINPDLLRMDDRAIAFVRAFVEAGKPIGSMGHGCSSRRAPSAAGASRPGRRSRTISPTPALPGWTSPWCGTGTS